MFSQRSTSRALLTAGVAAALALAPSAAWADDDPLPDVGQTLEDVVPDVDLPIGEDSEQTGQAAATATATTSESPPSDPVQEVIDEILAQFEGNPCADGVEAALRALLAQITDPTAFEEYQAALQAYLDDLVGLPEIDPTDPDFPEPPPLPSPPDPTAFQEALQALVTALQDCIPTPTSSAPPPPAPATTSTAGAPQPVSYPGYAPTGAVADEAPSPVLPAVGVALLVTGGLGAASWWKRSREARSEA